MLRRFFVQAVVLSTLVIAGNVWTVSAADKCKKTAETHDVVDTAVAAGSFKTLAAALKAADLIHTLKGDGPFTVLAPTDEAFAKLPAGTVEKLLKPENKKLLTKILTYHVVAGKASAKDVARLDDVKTVQGSSAHINIVDGRLTVDSASVIKTDIACTNGVIHVIDSVLMPQE